MKHANVAIFVPHSGCPHQCSFCDQKSITGQRCQPTPQDVHNTIQTAVQSLRENTQNVQIAFFGGSFTAIDKAYMLSLLQAAYPYVQNGQFYGIRISTRPDCISPAILQTLKAYGVTAIELGAQSMIDPVLLANGRGHTAQDVAQAAQLIKRSGFSLGLQMMTGLYKSNAALDMQTAVMLAALKPDTVRIYPTVVIKHTELAALYTQGLYIPPSLTDTVSLCAQLLTLFEGQGIRVIRLGLHNSESLQKGHIAGALHPALRQLCQSKRLLDEVLKQIRETNMPAGTITIRVHPKTVSTLVGQKKENIKKLNALSYRVVVVQDIKLKEDTVTVQQGGFTKKEKTSRVKGFHTDINKR